MRSPCFPKAQRVTKWRISCRTIRRIWERRRWAAFTEWLRFLGVFAKQRNATRSFVVYVCLSVCPSVRPSVRMDQLGSPLDGFSWNLVSDDCFSKIFPEFHYDPIRITGTLHVDRYTFLVISLPILFGRTNLQTKFCRENQNVYFIFNKVLFRKSYRLWDNVGKYCRILQATDYNTAHARCMLDTWGNKHTLRICNTHCLCNATVVTRICLYVTSYVHCPSWFILSTQSAQHHCHWV